MKFIIGIFIGVVLSVSMMSASGPRQQMLNAVFSWIEKIKTLPTSASGDAEPSLVETKSGDPATGTPLPEFSLPRPYGTTPHGTIPNGSMPYGTSSPGTVPSMTVPFVTERSSPERSLADLSPVKPPLTAPSVTEPSTTGLSRTEPSVTKPSNTGLSLMNLLTRDTFPLETSQQEIGTETEMPTSRQFQVAWSPFRRQTSANGFAAQLKHHLAHDFLVIKTGPGRYEVGFHFESDTDRTVVLSAINDLTGFKINVPPRITQL